MTVSCFVIVVDVRYSYNLSFVVRTRGSSNAILPLVYAVRTFHWVGPMDCTDGKTFVLSVLPALPNITCSS